MTGKMLIAAHNWIEMRPNLSLQYIPPRNTRASYSVTLSVISRNHPSQHESIIAVHIEQFFAGGKAHTQPLTGGVLRSTIRHRRISGVHAKRLESITCFQYRSQIRDDLSLYDSPRT
jgi:hypothetical protein